MTDIIEIALRLAGGFYAVVTFLALKTLAMSMFLDESIAALSSVDPETRAESARRFAGQRLRAALLLAAVLVSGLGGVALALMLELSVGLLAAAVLIFVGMLLASPFTFDRFDPPSAGVRRRSWVAVAVLSAVFLLAYVRWRAGRMVGLAQAEPWLVFLFAAATMGFLARAVQLWRSASGAPRLPDFAAEPDSEEADFAWFDDRRFVLQLTSGGSGLIDADNGEPVPFHYPLRELTAQDRADLEAWQDDFQRAVDPDDPRRARIADDGARADLAGRGHALHARLSGKLGARLSHEVDPRPRLPVQSVRQLILRAQTREWPLVDGDRPDEAIMPETLGLSIRLGDDLFDWLMDYDQADFPAERPPGLYDTPDWTPERIAAFDARGRALAMRVLGELAATGRSDVRVAVTSIAGVDAPVGIDRPI
jgi:phosphatidylserine synthase